MERPRRISAAYQEIEYEGNVDGQPSRFQRKLELVPVIDVSVEISRFRVPRSFIRRGAFGIRARCRMSEGLLLCAFARVARVAVLHAGTFFAI
jgi:hypothetical protein